MSDQAVLLLKWCTHRGINLVKGQLGHSYTFWTMPVMIFSLLSNSSHHPLFQHVQTCLRIAWIVKIHIILNLNKCVFTWKIVFGQKFTQPAIVSVVAKDLMLHPAETIAWSRGEAQGIMSSPDIPASRNVIVSVIQHLQYSFERQLLTYTKCFIFGFLQNKFSDK